MFTFRESSAPVRISLVDDCVIDTYYQLPPPSSLFISLEGDTIPLALGLNLLNDEGVTQLMGTKVRETYDLHSFISDTGGEFFYIFLTFKIKSLCILFFPIFSFLLIVTLIYRFLCTFW